MTQRFFIGIDGGATKCTVRVEDEKGILLGQENSGPANIRLSVTGAWQSIYSALEKILKPHSLRLETQHFYAGIGLAGCEVLEAYQDFVNHPHPFQMLVVTSDAHVACLGAHQGHDGAIIITGTGVVGYQICNGSTNKVSGWGFPHDDIGGGAWIGLKAIMLTLQWLDKRQPESSLAKAIYRYFQEDHYQLVNWANKANSTLFAELAPLVIQYSQEGDEMAMDILQQAARAINKVNIALIAAQSNKNIVLPCVLLGGIAPFLKSLLPSSLSSRLAFPQATPAKGAIFFVRHALKSEKTNE